MLGRLILLFTLVPFVELALLVWLGEKVGLLPTIVLVVSTGAVGAALARHQGLATWGRFQAALAEGRVPGRELIEGILILVAGAFLVTPGILTDSAGFVLLVPPLRRWLVARLERRFRGRVRVGGPGPRAPSGDVIDAEFEVHEREPPGN